MDILSADPTRQNVGGTQSIKYRRSFRGRTQSTWELSVQYADDSALTSMPEAWRERMRRGGH